MIDPKKIREDFEGVKANLGKRRDPEIVEKLEHWAEKDKKWRDLKQEVDDLRAERNKVTEQIKVLKSKGEDASEMMGKAKEIPAKLKEKEALMKELEENNYRLLMGIPNLLHESVPFGKDDTENVEEKRWGDAKEREFEVMHHGEFAKSIGGADFERAVKISGAGFFYLKGDLALLDLALQRLALDMLLKKGFTPVQPPLMMNRKAYEGTIDLGDFETVMYKIEGDDLYMIATSEHPLVSMRMNEILEEKELEEPIKMAGISPCFRKEIGKHGLDERGFFRVHQFNKIEQVVLCKPEDSWKIFEDLSKNQQEFIEALGMPYRIVNVCTGDMGVVASKKYDLEVWSPREKKFIEIGSCSNCTSYQSIRLNIKYRKEDGTKEYVHTLNNTMVPTTRTLRVLIENFQTKEGNLAIPEALQPYMGGKKEIQKQPPKN